MIAIYRRRALLPTLAMSLIMLAGNYCFGWSTTRLFSRLGEVGRTARRRRTSPLRYQEEGQQEELDSNNKSNDNSPAADDWMLSQQQQQYQQQHSPKVNTSFLDLHREELIQWLTTLSGVERSEPLWVGNDLLHVSPSDVLQSRLDSLLLGTATSINLFSGTTSNSIRLKVKFDWDWKYALVKLLSQEEEWTAQHWKRGISNTHPLRLQLVAIPPHTSLPPHVHPAIELDIPLLGTLYEERPATNHHDDDDYKIPFDVLDRAPHHSLGTPLSDFSEQPTPEELQQIHQDLTDRVSNEYQLHNLFAAASKWETRSIKAGESLVNSVGSIHRSFTKEEPCLLFVLGPNVHAHFKD